MLRERISKLSTAALRISSSLHMETVLQEVIDSALVLTGARRGLITTIDMHGGIRNCMASGMSAEELQTVLAWLDAPQFFKHLRDDIKEAFRVEDMRSYLESLGLLVAPWVPRTMQVAPLRHQGEHLGYFFLCNKEDGEMFTAEDEEVLLLFASQAAAAIVNARTHRDEHKARAHLEALVETSPIGVAVFDAQTGYPVSLNREAWRIAEKLRTSDQSPEQILEIVTCRLSDGREMTFAESPMNQFISNAETVRLEQIVLSVPDGRSVTMLVNATPIQSADGAVESMVVTMQDLAPLQEANRLRTEFLSMVSHELRVPLAAIKGSAATVLEASRVLDRAEVRQFFRIIEAQVNHMNDLISDLLDAGHIDSGTLLVDPEPVEVTALVDLARTTFLSGGGRQTIHIDLPPDLPRVMADERRIVQVLNNLFSNASRHAPESSAIHVSAVRDGVHVAISVTDEGQGVPPERLPHLFRKYTDDRDGNRSHGVGLGLAICKGLVEAHGGRIRAENAGPGQGTRFTFTIPLFDEVETGATEVPTHRRRRTGRQRPLVLAVDDDPQFLGYIRTTLDEAGFNPLVASDPNEVSDLIDKHDPHLVLLDLLLPEMDGIELMQKVPALADRPVIFLSAYGRDETIARALEMGAVDYIVKPFSPTELVARIQVALRKSDVPPETFRSGALVINYEERRVTVSGVPVRLTATEYDLLRMLSTNAGRVVTYEKMLRSVWRSSDSVDTRRVRAFVKKLRCKLDDDASNPTYIFTEPRVGYRMHRPAGDVRGPERA